MSSPSEESDEVQIATLAYGVGNWYFVRGDDAYYVKLFSSADGPNSAGTLAPIKRR